MTDVLVLKSVKADMTAHGGFVWPRSGPVECPDWKPTAECGNGLHGWRWGEGDFSLKVKDPDAVWLVVRVPESDIVDLSGKVKFPRGVVTYAGNFGSAFRLVRSEWARATRDYGHASATGDSGHASATGDCGHASATGNSGHASATGNSGHASATGYSGHASATGDYGHASATGNSGHASATGYSGHASATGYSGHACVLGVNGLAKASTAGSVILTYIDAEGRRRHSIGYVGENGIEADTWYRCDGEGNLVEA